MALTITYDGFGVVADADNKASDAQGGSWLELGGGTITDNPDVPLYLGGANPAPQSIGSKYASKTGFTYFSKTTPLNFSTTENGQYVYFWVNIQSALAFDTLVNDGLFIMVGSDTSNYYKFLIAGNDDANGWPGGWKLFVCDITLGTVVGTPDDTAINTFGIWIDTVVSVRADSIFLSQIMCAKGLRVEGTSTTLYDDIVAWTEDYVNRAAGMFQSRGKTYFSLGSLTLHSDTANTVVSADGSNVEYEKSEFWNGTIWTTLYPVDANVVTAVNTAANTVTFTDTNIGMSGNDVNKTALDVSAAGVYLKKGGYLKYLSSISAKSGDGFDGVVFSLYDALILGLETYTSCTFDGSSTLTVGATSDFANGNTVNGKSGVISTTVTSLSEIASGSFNSSGSNHAVELTSIGAGSMTWDAATTGYDAGATGSPVTATATGNEDIYVNVASGTLTINVAAGATIPSIRSAGAIVNVVAGLVTLTISTQDGNEVRIRQGSHSLFHIQDVTGGETSYSYTFTANKLITITVGASGFSRRTDTIELPSSDTNLLYQLSPNPSYI